MPTDGVTVPLNTWHLRCLKRLEPDGETIRARDNSPLPILNDPREWRYVGTVSIDWASMELVRTPSGREQLVVAHPAVDRIRAIVGRPRAGST